MIQPGVKIYEIRTQKGWTQAELAQRAGLAQANLSHIEQGRRDLTVSTLVRLAAALEVRPAELLEDRPEAAPLTLTRAHLEALAQAVLVPGSAVAPELEEAAGLFREALVDAGPRTSARRTIHAWNRLRRRFSSQEIQSVSERIRDARQRAHAQKTD